MSQTFATDPNVIMIVVGSYTLSGWQQARIMRSIEHFPSSFVLELTEFYPDQPTQIVVNPGDPIKVMFGKDVALTGYVDDYYASIGPSEHQVRITGRSKCADLLDCSAGEAPYQLNNKTLLSLAQNLIQLFGVTVSAPDGDSLPVPIINVELTSSPYEILEHFARWANFIITDDTNGNLVICKVGKKSAASGFVQSVNVQQAAVTFSMQNRHTSIGALFISTGFFDDNLPPAAGSSSPVIPHVPRAQAYDKGFPRRADNVPRYRPLLFLSEQSQNSNAIAAQRAQWEMARRIGRSQAVSITADSWRDSAGALWAPNTMAAISLPALKLKATWLIATVTFVRDERGTTAELVLMPPTAFQPEPENLLPFDAQIDKALPGGGAGRYAPAPR